MSVSASADKLPICAKNISTGNTCIKGWRKKTRLRGRAREDTELIALAAPNLMQTKTQSSVDYRSWKGHHTPTRPGTKLRTMEIHRPNSETLTLRAGFKSSLEASEGVQERLIVEKSHTQRKRGQIARHAAAAVRLHDTHRQRVGG